MRPSSAVHVCSSPCSSGRSATSMRGSRVDASATSPKHQRMRVDRVRAPRADPAAAARRGRRASRSAAAGRATRRRGASTARARSRPSASVRTSSRSSRRTGWKRNSKLQSAIAPAAARLGDERRRLVGVRARTACRTAPPCPRRARARTCAACRNGGECTLTRSTSGARDRARDRVVVARRDDVDDLAAVGRGERGRDDARAEPGADHRRPSLPHHLGRVVVHRQMEAAQAGVRQRPEA